MITWMLLALLASAMLAGAAFALEQTARLLGRARRWAWLASMVAAACLPALFRLLPAETAEAASTAPVDAALLAELLTLAPAAAPDAGRLTRLLHSPLAAPILSTLWAAATSGLLIGLAGAYRRLQRVRASGVHVRISGFPALVTDATGPVVIGVARPEIVLPRWIGSLSEEERRLVVQHEWEHVRAGDPRLLMLAALLVAAMPWNLPLWWMRARLRQALEIDCDARVLAAGADRRTYGRMLIQTAGRPGPAPLLVPALVEVQSALERRIVAMTARIPEHRRIRIVASTALAALLFAAACEMTPRGSSPSPTEPDLANVMEPEAEGASERVLIRVTADDSIVSNVESGHVSPEGDVTIVRVSPEGDTSEVRMRIRASPLADLERDGARPLYIVDGERVESIESLDPSRIVTIDVLKGPMAVARFGADAEDGVVQIRTGEPGEAVRLPLRESRASARQEDVLDISRDGVGVRIAKREPGNSRIDFFMPENSGDRPLILVDGEPGTIEGLDPSRVEKIEVIKDPTAAARYGPDARNGVILVTLKQ